MAHMDIRKWKPRQLDPEERRVVENLLSKMKDYRNRWQITRTDESDSDEVIQEAIANGIPITLGLAPFAQRVVITDFESGEKIVEVWIANEESFTYTVDEPTNS